MLRPAENTAGYSPHLFRGKNPSERNLFVGQSEVVFKLMQRNPRGAPNFLFGLGFFFHLPLLQQFLPCTS